MIFRCLRKKKKTPPDDPVTVQPPNSLQATEVYGGQGYAADEVLTYRIYAKVVRNGIAYYSHVVESAPLLLVMNDSSVQLDYPTDFVPDSYVIFRDINSNGFVSALDTGSPESTFMDTNAHWGGIISIEPVPQLG